MVGRLRCAHNDRCRGVAGNRAEVDGQPDEHVWYDFPTVAAVAGKVADALEANDPAHAASYQRNLESFVEALAGLEKLGRLGWRKSHAGVGVAITEPVPLYLLQACGAGEPHATAVQRGGRGGARTSRPASCNRRWRSSPRIKSRALVHNEQTVDVATTQVSHAAKAAGIPVVGMTETLPRGQSYLSWMSANVTALEKRAGPVRRRD